MFTWLWGEWGGLIGKCLYCALRQLYERQCEREAFLLFMGVIIPSVVGVNAAFSEGVYKEGMQVVVLQHVPVGEVLERMSSLQRAPRLCLPCLQSLPTHLLAPRGGSSWALTALGLLQTWSTQTELSLLQLMLNMAIFNQKGLKLTKFCRQDSKCLTLTISLLLWMCSVQLTVCSFKEL